MAEENVTELQIQYIRKDIKDFSTKLDVFIGKQDGRFEQIATTYVRQDNLSLILGPMEKQLDEICKFQQTIIEYIPMLKDLKKERDSVKSQLISVGGKVLFWLFVAVIGFYIASK